MNTFDIIAIICSLVALLCSAVAPVVAAFINSHASKKIKKIELFYEKKFNAYHDFVEASGEYVSKGIHYPTFAKSINSAILVANDAIARKLNELFSKMAKAERSTLLPDVNEIIELMRADLDNSKSTLFK